MRISLGGEETEKTLLNIWSRIGLSSFIHSHNGLNYITVKNVLDEKIETNEIT